MFNEVDPKKSLPEIEHDQIKHWNLNKIFEKSVLQNQNQPKFVFFDGPPFANGLPHYGHILAQSLKDAVTRYWTMQGKYVPRTNGWDCHGLPVEYEIEKQLELSGHKDILEMGVEVFNDKCKESVFKYTNEWEQLFERLGRWFDSNSTYATLENRYMESIWWVFKQIWDKGLVYKGYRVMQVCPRCETSLSNFEVSQGYKDVTDLSAVAKFPLIDQENTFILAWTTTPWTLPGNQALAIGPEIKYVKIKLEDQFLILAEDLLEKNLPKDKFDYEIIQQLSADDLAGLKYTPIFDYYKNTADKNFVVLKADFVTTEDGTGIVHIAGGFGEDDYNLCREHDLEPIQHVKLDGHFKPEVTDYADKFFKGQDQNIVNALKEKGLLFKSENYRHSYPHCWRDDTPLMNYCLDAWFIKVSEIKDQLIANNQKINWQPDHIKDGRFGKWLENVKDWNISRNRFWGCPIPVWESDTEDHSECISSIHELRMRAKAGNTLIFVRHGFAEHNEKGVLNSNLNNISNLTDKGKEQAQTLAKKLKEAGKKIDLIISSPFQRTIQTAEIINEKFGAEIKVSDTIREHDCGNLDGQPFEIQTQELLNAENPYTHIPGQTGESLEATEQRMIKFLDEVAAEHEGKTILVVTHGGPLSLVKRYLENTPINADIIKNLAYIDHEEFYEFEVGNIPTNAGELDLHKPYIDHVKIPCPVAASKGKKGTMHRVKEVFDCWFESGSMPYAQMHYPFENKTEFEQNFPADFIAEGLDQTRGWFYTLHVISTILFDQPAFKNVIVNGILLAANGEKLSKRKKNYPDPTELFETKGVDSTRLFLYQSTAPLAEDVRFSEDHVDEIVKKFTLTLYNTYSFFVTYSNIDNFNPAIDGNLEGKELHELDQWLLSEFNQLIIEVSENMNAYNLSKATRPLINFVDNLSNWYIRRSRRRFWKSENDSDKKQAYATLYFVLTEFCKLIAPFTPFIADEIYRNLTGNESVHLEKWPVVNKKMINKELNQKMQLARTIVSLGHAIRSHENLKVRQPLSKIKVAVPSKELAVFINQLEDVITEELNVKSLEILENPDKEVTKLLKPNAKELGPILGQKMKEVLQAARENKFEIQENTVLICDEKLNLNKFEVVYQAKEGYSADSQNGIVVVLDTNITKSLKQEGLVRDIVRLVQEFRKEMDYNVSDRIYLYLETEDQDLQDAILNFADYLKKETLAIELQNSGDFEWDSEKLTDVDSIPLTIAIKKAEV